MARFIIGSQFVAVGVLRLIDVALPPVLLPWVIYAGLVAIGMTLVAFGARAAASQE